MNTKKIMTIGVASIIAVVGLSAGFYFMSHQPAPSVQAATPVAVDENATDESVSFLVDTMNGFSIDLYQKLCGASQENEFISPYSIFVALAMTYEGARGETAEQMQSVLGIPQQNNTVQCSFGYLYNLLNQEKEYTLRTGNALWTQEEYPFLTAYLAYLELYYMAHAQDVDFLNPQSAAETINDWIEENTGDMIQDFLSAGDIDPLTRMILTNAIYFKGDWKYQFDEDNTILDAFTLADGSMVNVSMMQFSDSEITFNYTETQDVQIIKLPYNGDAVSMMILLPKENNISFLENQLSLENLTNWRNQMNPTNVKVYLPSFSLEEEYRVDAALQDMGMNLPFGMDADFSGMNGAKDLFIEKVKHKAVVDVTEQGTEAAAVSSVHMTLKSVMPGITFKCDHPFLFLIQEEETGSILFMGKVTNPA